MLELAVSLFPIDEAGAVTAVEVLVEALCTDNGRDSVEVRAEPIMSSWG